MSDLIVKGAGEIKDGLYNIKDGKLFKYKANGGTVRTYTLLKPKEPIVRCKDCKHRYVEDMIWHCPFGLMGGENFFCGYGSLGTVERRRDG